LVMQEDERVARCRSGIVGQQIIVLGLALTAGALLLALADMADVSHYGRLIFGASVVCLITYLQLEFARGILVKLGRSALLLANAGWYALVIAVLAAGALLEHLPYWILLAALCSAMVLQLAAIAILVGVDLRGGFRLLASDCRNYGFWSAVATASYAGYNHVPLLILGALLPPVHAAAFVATRSLMQPLQILLRGLDLADKSSFAKGAGAPQDASALRHTMKLAGLYAGVAGLFGIAIALWADQIVALAYGAKFAHLGPVLIAWVPVTVLMSVAMPFESLVYARQLFHGYYLVRSAASALAIVLTIPLVIGYSEVGAILGSAIGWLATVAGALTLFLRKKSA
jgi:O-antigen/teichoic acid export membrane protein